MYVSFNANGPTLNLWLGKGGSYTSTDIPEQLTSPGAGYKTFSIEVFQVSSKGTKEQIQEKSKSLAELELESMNLRRALMMSNLSLHHLQAEKQRIL